MAVIDINIHDRVLETLNRLFIKQKTLKFINPLNLDVYEQKEYLQSLADKNYKSTIDLSAIKYDIEVCKLPPALLK